MRTNMIKEQSKSAPDYRSPRRKGYILLYGAGRADRVSKRRFPNIYNNVIEV